MFGRRRLSDVFKHAVESVQDVANRAVARLRSFADEAIQSVNDAAIEAVGGAPDLDSPEYERLDDAIASSVSNILNAANDAADFIFDNAQEIVQGLEDEERLVRHEEEAISEYEHLGMSDDEAETLLGYGIGLIDRPYGGRVRRRRFAFLEDAYRALLDQYASVLPYVVGVIKRKDGYYLVIMDKS